MSTYFIDSENINISKDLSGLAELKECDIVFLFIGNLAKTVPTSLLSDVVKSHARVRVKLMKTTAKNYMDFQISTCLGEVIANDILDSFKTDYLIISKDTGYQAVVDYWKNNAPPAKVKLQASILNTAPNEKVKKSSTPLKKLRATPVKGKVPEKVRKKVRAAMSATKFKTGNYTAIYALFLESGDLQTLHDKLVASFTSERGNIIYDNVKDIFLEFKSGS